MKQAFTSIDVLKLAREIMAGGGVASPKCRLAPFCLYCCAAKAKSQLDDEHGTGVSSLVALSDVLTGNFDSRPSDQPLVDARNMLSTVDSDDAHTQESALAILDKLIKEFT